MIAMAYVYHDTLGDEDTATAYCGLGKRCAIY